tara:strand:+ start:286 stop:1206 length:921 start_codon:yes stop_codon:yes gene_type:complete
MNGLFVGTTNGLYFVEPENDPICEIKTGHVEYIDSNENGLSAAIIKNKGLYIRTDNGKWDLKWPGEIVSLQITQNNEIIAGVLPTKLIISKDRGNSWQESKGVQSYIGNSSIETFTSKKNSQKIQSIIEISGSILISIAQVGILISHNLGSSWVRSSDGIEEDIELIFKINNDNETIYAMSNNNLYKTDDFALNWNILINENSQHNLIDAIAFNSSDGTFFLGVTNNNKTDHKLVTITKSNSSEYDLSISSEKEFNSQTCIIKLPNSEDTAFLGYDKKVWASHNQGQDWLQIKELQYNILSMAVCF